MCLVALIATAGCNTGKGDVSKERLEKMSGGNLKKVVPVSGTVTIDGKPEKNVNLYIYKASEPGAPLSTIRTKEDGTYCWSTYLSCDGLEPGDYMLGFEYIPKPKKNDTGKDEFKGKYKNPAKNADYKLTVKEGAPMKDVNYDLKMK